MVGRLYDGVLLVVLFWKTMRVFSTLVKYMRNDKALYIAQASDDCIIYIYRKYMYALLSFLSVRNTLGSLMMVLGIECGCKVAWLYILTVSLPACFASWLSAPLFCLYFSASGSTLGDDDDC